MTVFITVIQKQKNKLIMKKILVILLVLFSLHTIAINVKNKPHVITQPDGIKIECFITGDEFGGMIHDAEGYAFKRDKETGWWYYATEKDGKITCSEFVVGTVQPKAKGLKKGLMEFNEAFYKDVSERRKANKGKFKVEGGILKSVGGTMTINTLVVFIRFDGGTEFVHDRNYYDPFFNSTTSTSLKDYFQEVSYNQFDVNSTFYPLCASNTNLSYEDDYPRDYYIDDDYEANGYANDNERTSREHGLLKRAVEAIASQVPTNINLDADSDGKVDHVCFIVRGGSVNIDHGDLLWPHQWSLHSQTAYINSKRVYEYTFLNSDLSFSKETICHEFFHVLGAPDLYHYPTNDPDLEPAAYWDIMGDRHDNFPHMGAYMKNEYGGWISTIPEISEGGNYTLNPITSSSNNCYKIKSPYNCDEYFIVEYRKQSGDYEGTIEGNGLLVYRINPSGNNAIGPDDEVYIYRPNGTLTVNGQAYDAEFSSQSGRTAINDNTNPGSFLCDNGVGGLKISNIGSSGGSTISFTVEFVNEVSGPDHVCTDGSEYTCAAPPSGYTISWLVGSNLEILSGGNTNTPTIKALSNSSGGEGWIKSQLTKTGSSCTISSNTKYVGVNQPIYSDVELELRTTSGTPVSFMCPNTHYHIFLNNSSSCSLSSYTWTLPAAWTVNYQYNNMISVYTNSIPGGMVEVYANTCCGVNKKVVTDYFPGGYCSSSFSLVFSPNPTSGETTLSIVTDEVQEEETILKSAYSEPIFDEAIEWDLEVYDNVQNLKLKKNKLKGNSTKIQTASWKEGIYMVRVKYKDEILNGKLVVKK